MEIVDTELGIEVFQLIILIGFIFATAAIDAMHYSKGEWVKNKRDRWLQRCMFMLGLSLSGWMFIDAIFFALVFMGLFDFSLNILRGLDNDHLGKDSYWDRFWRRHYWLYRISRFVFFGLGVFGIFYF